MLLAILLAGCRSVRQTERAADLASVPDRYGTPLVGETPVAELGLALGSPELDRFLEATFSDNLDLRQAWARIEEARAIARGQGARLWPTVEAGGRGTRSRAPAIEQVGLGTGPVEDGAATLPSAQEGTINQFQASLAAAYELDVWRRLGNLKEAAEFEAAAARWDAEALALTLGAEVAETYFELVAQRERIGLLEAQFRVSGQFVQLTLARLAQGHASALDVNQQKQQAESLRGLLVQTRANQAVTRHRLLVLMGRSPTEALSVEATRLPELSALPDPGVPAALLHRRPDIRAAWLRLEASDRRTASAVADLFPRLRLTATLVYQERELVRLFGEGLWSLAVAGMQPLWDGGRRFAAIDRAEAAAEGRLYRYGQVVLVALREVRDALVLEGRQREFVTSLELQRDLARQALDLARRRYREGTVDYLRVLTPLLSLQRVEQDLVEARRRELAFRLQLTRALGGTWGNAGTAMAGAGSDS